MNEEDRIYLTAAFGRIEQLLTGGVPEPLRPEGLSTELEVFAGQFGRLLGEIASLREFSIALSNGDLNYEPPPKAHLLDPLKHLQGNLRHLVWQTKAIAAGDLEQRVDFLGEFSDCFNQMIERLREKRAAEEKARYIGLHDTLTGLYNRTYFNEELERLRSARTYPVSFLVADLDNLKVANDTHGHEFGDLLIQRSARVLANCVRAHDVVARLGGDEFVIILQGADRAEASSVIARIGEAVDAYNKRDKTLLPILLSLGSGTTVDADGLNEALRLADRAMYRDKSRRKGVQCYRTYEL